jgi:hypothetical protein
MINNNATTEGRSGKGEKKKEKGGHEEQQEAQRADD